MKNTIRFKQIGDHIIINRFDQLPVDGKLTELKNRSTIQALPERAAVESKVQQKNVHVKKYNQALGKIRSGNKIVSDGPGIITLLENSLLTATEARKPLIEAEINNIKVRVEQVKQLLPGHEKEKVNAESLCTACDCELSELNNVFSEAKKGYIRNHQIFSPPRKNEVVLTDSLFAEIKELFDNRGPNKQIKIEIENIESVVLEAVGDQPEIKASFPVYKSHAVVDDFRGKQYFWLVDSLWTSSEVITDLSVKNEIVDAIEKAELTPKQSEEIRLQGLTQEQKDSEKATEIDQAATEAALMRSKDEIQGMTAAAAKTKATTWYNEQVALIEAKYS